MKQRTKLITTAAIAVSLIVIFGALPYVFFVPVLMICICFGWGMTLIGSAAFGVVSLCYAFMGGSVVSVAFVEAPWIPILPRIIAGLGAHGVYVLAAKFIHRESKAGRYLPAALSAAAGSVLNTALVVLCLLFFVPDAALEGITIYVYVPVMLINGAIELAVNLLVVPPVSLTVKKALYYSRKG